MEAVKLHDITAMKDVSKNECDMDTSKSSFYSSTDSSESSDSISSESYDSRSYSTSGSRRDMVQRKKLFFNLRALNISAPVLLAFIAASSANRSTWM